MRLTCEVRPAYHTQQAWCGAGDCTAHAQEREECACAMASVYIVLPASCSLGRQLLPTHFTYPALSL